MLVLSRRTNEKILLPTLNASVSVVSIKPGVVRLGFECPPEVPVLREEIFDRNAWEQRHQQQQAAQEQSMRKLIHQLRNRLNSSAIGLALMRRQLAVGLHEDMIATLERVAQEFGALQENVEEITRPKEAPPPTGRRRALLVEDDHNERELLAGFLRLAGLEVDTAGDGADALDYLSKSGRPDVVLLDMLLPRCDGPTTVRAIRSEPAYEGLKIFAVTGSSPERLGVCQGPGGVDGWFSKPLNPESLLSALQENLDKIA